MKLRGHLLRLLKFFEDQYCSVWIQRDTRGKLFDLEACMWAALEGFIDFGV